MSVYNSDIFILFYNRAHVYSVGRLAFYDDPPSTFRGTLSDDRLEIQICPILRLVKKCMNIGGNIVGTMRFTSM